MGNYVKSTNFASKDNLPQGDPLKVVKGTEIDAEFNAIATAVSSKADLASPTFTGTPFAPTAAVGANTNQVATTAFVNAEIANDAPTKTGGGASGTWNISISGNAATATTASTVNSANTANELLPTVGGGGISFSSGECLVRTSNTLTGGNIARFLRNNGANTVYTFQTNGLVQVDGSASLSDNQSISYIINAGARQVAMGVRKNAGLNPAGFVFFTASNGTSQSIWVDNSGLLRIGSPQTLIGGTGGTVVGDQTSDERVKNIYGPVEYGVKEVMALKPIKYSFKSDTDNTVKLGFIAQQTQSVVPESVYNTQEEITEGEPTKLAMEYVALIPVLVKAMQEQQGMIEALKAEVEELKRTA
jgi:hypothetical protein